MENQVFDGAEYNHQRDSARLSDQYRRVFTLMTDGKGRTLKEISEATGDPEPSISARLRDMRKERFGSHKVLKQYLGDGLYMYTLDANQLGD